MMVSGLVLQMTGESAQRAALGAGAIVMDVIALNDGRRPHEKIRRLRQLRPDMILLSGGTDGGDVRRVCEMAEILLAADPRPARPATAAGDLRRELGRRPWETPRQGPPEHGAEPEAHARA
jgi:hypothetical protein